MTKRLKYDSSLIITGKGTLSVLDSFLKKKAFSRYYIICDENTSTYCLPQLIMCSDLLSDAHIIELESGENSKVLGTCQNLWLTLQEQGTDKNTLIINLGGGVVTDLGGFAAAVYKRGIPFINIPTSLLAMVDASVGGKNGVDFNGVKNLLGTIVQPQLVLADQAFLRTLPERHIKNGMAEIIKISAVCDATFWKRLNSFRSHATYLSEDVIFHAIKLKHEVVKKDPEEKHLRKCLNFGHSIGHALESASLEMGLDLLHGEAIAAGMILETHVAYRSGQCSKSWLNQVVRLINRYYKKTGIPKELEEKILGYIKHDKKNEHQSLVFAIASGPGKFALLKNIHPDLIREAIHFYKLI